MAAITINDLPTNILLDRKAMRAIRGGDGAPWVYGWILPFSPKVPGAGGAMNFNFYQVNNTFVADQMINQFQIVDVKNSASNTNINVGLDEGARNFK